MSKIATLSRMRVTLFSTKTYSKAYKTNMTKRKRVLRLTFLDRGVETGDLHGQPVDPGLDSRAPPGQLLSLREQVAEHLLRVAGQRRQLSYDIGQAAVRHALQLVRHGYLQSAAGHGHRLDQTLGQRHFDNVLRFG